MPPEPRPPFLKNIGFMLTYKCTASCPHCIVRTGPHRRREMRLDEAIDWIDQVSAYRGNHILSLGLTGGEPFYDLDRLEVIAGHAREKGLFVTTVTNAFWATTPERAKSVLERLKGIQMISLSTDTYHQEMIPLENIRNALGAARETGHLADLTICTENKADPALLQMVENLRGCIDRDRMKVAITAPVGRASSLAEHGNFAMDGAPAGGGCGLAGSPLVFPDGKVIGCTGAFVALPPAHPMVLGDLRQESLAAILDRSEDNLFLQAMRIWGPFGFYRLLKDHGQGPLLPEQYIRDCPCDACFKIFTSRQLVRELETILREEETVRMIAYGRAVYLGEPAMAQRLGLPPEFLSGPAVQEDSGKRGSMVS